MGEIRIVRIYFKGYGLQIHYNGNCMWRSTKNFPNQYAALKYIKAFLNVEQWIVIYSKKD